MDLEFCKFMREFTVPAGFRSSVVHDPLTQLILSNESEDVQYELALNKKYKLMSVGIHFGILQRMHFNPFEVYSSFFYSSFVSVAEHNKQSYARLKYHKPAYFSNNKETINNMIGMLDNGEVLEFLVGY